MSREELAELSQELTRLAEAHGDEFEKWYDQANEVRLKAYALTGWLVERKLL